MSHPQYLQVALLDFGWGKKLLAVLHTTRGCEGLIGRWRALEVSDLSFSINFRLAFIREIVNILNSTLQQLGRELDERPPTPEMLSGEEVVAYTFTDRGLVFRALAMIVAFSVEAEALFDNLVEFYRRFLGELDGSVPAKSEAEATIKRISAADWHLELDRFRNRAVHRFAPWLAFEVPKAGGSPYHPVLAYDWRPERLSPATSTQLETLSEIWEALVEAARQTEWLLVDRIKSSKPGAPR